MQVSLQQAYLLCHSATEHDCIGRWILTASFPASSLRRATKLAALPDQQKCHISKALCPVHRAGLVTSTFACLFPLSLRLQQVLDGLD